MREPYPRYDKTPALYNLIILNVGVYAIWQVWGFENYDLMRLHFLLSSESVLAGRMWTLITTMFSHVEPMHLLFNMFALWVFGMPVERVMGPYRFAGLYLAGGLAGGVGYLLWALSTGSAAAALGASGAVMAVAVAFGMWFPHRTLMINLLIPVPAWLAVLLYIALDVFGMLGGGGMLGDNIAHAAHIGGAVGGALWALPRFLALRR